MSALDTDPSKRIHADSNSYQTEQYDRCFDFFHLNFCGWHDTNDVKKMVKRAFFFRMRVAPSPLCTICLETNLIGRIFQCGNGHLVCETCFTTLGGQKSKCPTCGLHNMQSNARPIRNLFAEECAQCPATALKSEHHNESHSSLCCCFKFHKSQACDS